MFGTKMALRGVVGGMDPPENTSVESKNCMGMEHLGRLG